MKKKNAKAAKEVQEPQGEEAGQAKKKKRNPLMLIIPAVVLIAAIAVVVIFVVLPKLGGGENPDDLEAEPSEEPVYYELPESFDIGEETVGAIEPVEAAGVQATRAVRICYTYTGLTDTGAEVSAYVSKLKSEGFSVVDEEFVRTSAPDYSTPEGVVLLAKNLVRPAAETGTGNENSEDGQPAEPVNQEKPVDMVLTMELTWSGDTCVVVGDQAEGRVTSPPPEQQPSGGGAAMSMREAADYLASLPPSVLELSGTSMENYRVYAQDGTVMVDGKPCLRLQVYSRDNPENTNEFAGTYLMSADGQHLYLLNEDAGTVRELEMP